MNIDDLQLSPSQKSQVLIEALPYIRKFRGSVVVIKYGGSAMDDREALNSFADDVNLLHSVGLRPVVVHGGGPQVSAMMQQLGKTPEFRNGQRVTDADTLDIARMVLVGKINRDIVSAICSRGDGSAVGLSGEDAGLLSVKQMDPELGFVGDIEHVDSTVVHRLLQEDLIPVIATIGSDLDGQAYNINADAVAGAVAESVNAGKLVFLTDVEGLYSDPNDPSTVLSSVSAEALQALLVEGVLTGGMIPKIEACVNATRNGVPVAHILDGREPHALLLEIFTTKGIGTMVTP